MSQEDKFKEAQRLYETANADQRYVLERLFPEFKESEDERTRQEIVRFIRMEVEDEIVGNKWIAWLEKQGKNSTVKPRFKIGDWIVFNGLILYVKEVVNGFYRTISKGGIPNSYNWDIDNIARLWTIQDAKDGDVLVSLNRMHPFIFNGHYDEDTDYVYAYCGISDIIKDDSFYFDKYPDEEFKVWDLAENVRPATRDQRNLLFSKMKDSGYEWDADNKELKLHSNV